MRLILLAAVASLLLSGCVARWKYERDLQAMDTNCKAAIELFGELCKAKLLELRGTKGLRY